VKSEVQGLEKYELRGFWSGKNTDCTDLKNCPKASLLWGGIWPRSIGEELD